MGYININIMGYQHIMGYIKAIKYIKKNLINFLTNTLITLKKFLAKLVKIDHLHLYHYKRDVIDIIYVVLRLTRLCLIFKYLFKL